MPWRDRMAEYTSGVLWLTTSTKRKQSRRPDRSSFDVWWSRSPLVMSISGYEAVSVVRTSRTAGNSSISSVSICFASSTMPRRSEPVTRPSVRLMAVSMSDSTKLETP